MKQITILLLCLLSVLSLQGQRVLTLQECRGLAIEHSIDGEIARQQSLKANYTLKSVRANYFPKISFDAMSIFSDFKMTENIGDFLPDFIINLIPDLNMNIELELDAIYNARLTVQQPIFMGGKIIAANKMARIGTEMAKLNETLSSAEIIYKCDEAYLNCIKVKNLYLAAEKYKEVLDEIHRTVSNAISVGAALQNDLLTIQIKLNEAELNLQRAKNGITLAKMNLCYTIGLPLTTKIEVSETFDDNFNIPQKYDLSLRPELALLSKQIEFREQQIRLQRSDFLPSLGVAGMYGYTKGMKVNGTNMLDGFNFGAVVSLSIPLFHWGEGVNKIRTAKVERKIAQLQHQDVENKMQLEITMARNSLNEAILEVQLTHKSEKQAEENMNSVKNRYDVGMATLANILEAQTMWQKTHSDYINAEVSRALSQTRYLKTIGQLSYTVPEYKK